MKIVHYRSPYLPIIGGAEISVDYLGKYFIKKNHQFIVLTKTLGYIDSPYKIVRLNTRYKILLWLIKNPYDIINIHNYSIFFQLAHKNFYPLYALRKFNKSPIVFTLRGSKQLYQKRKMWEKLSYEIKKSDFTIFIDHFMLKYAKELNLRNYAYIPNSVDTSLFSLQEKNKVLIDSLNLSKKFVVLTISRLSRERNVELILDVASIMKDKKDIIFLIIGGGANERYLKNLAQQKECKNVIFLGEVQNSFLPKFLSVADIFLNPLNLPGIGRNVLEAMACGKAILRRNIEDDPLLKNWKNFVSYEDINDIVDKILTLHSDKNLTEKIGNDARKFILENCSIEVVGSKVEKIYKKLVD